MNITKLSLLFSLCLVLSACFGPVKTDQISVYTLKVPQDINIPRSSRSVKTLLVTLPVANPGFSSSNMVYVMVPYNLRYFSQHRWVAPPTEMILPILADVIRAKGYFKAVLVPPFSGITTYRLDTNLITLQQEFIQPTSQIRLAMQVSIINNTTNKVVASRRFQVLLPTSANNPYSGVLTANKATDKMAHQIARFVLRSV